jgi:thiosulfate dehydrogenase
VSKTNFRSSFRNYFAFCSFFTVFFVSYTSVYVLDAQEQPRDELPAGELGEVIRLGEAIVENTVEHPLSKAFVGNKLNCTSCHLNNGKHQRAGTFIGTATAYPAWAPREKRVITLEDRVLNCFMRSCNGVRPPMGSQVSIAVTTYISWLSNGQPIRQNEIRPVGPGAIKPLEIKATEGDGKRGENLYASRCAECHGADGLGDGANPPVWGPQSYSNGAGLSNSDHLAAWLKVAMPLDNESLTEQEAIDIAVYVNSKERPRFELREHLPPNQDLGRYNGVLDESPKRNTP